jgi:hypothetical protein
MRSEFQMNQVMGEVVVSVSGAGRMAIVGRKALEVADMAVVRIHSGRSRMAVGLIRLQERIGSMSAGRHTDCRPCPAFGARAVSTGGLILRSVAKF